MKGIFEREAAMEYVQLQPSLISVDLADRCVHIQPNHEFSCFFLVQHTNDRVFIEKLATQLLLAGCRSFDFHGKHEPLWHDCFDDADIMLNPDATPEDVALTSGWKTLEDFAEALYLDVSAPALAPHDVYLMYDDRSVYEAALKLLETLLREDEQQEE